MHTAGVVNETSEITCQNRLDLCISFLEYSSFHRFLSEFVVKFDFLLYVHFMSSPDDCPIGMLVDVGCHQTDVW